MESLDKLKCSHVWLGKREEKIQLVERLLDQYIRSHQSQDTVYRILSICIYTIYHIDPKYIETETLRRLVRINGLFLEMILETIDPIDLTHELLLEAVKQNGLALKFINKSYRTYCILLAAVNQNGMALGFIDHCDQTYRLRIEAVKQTYNALQYIDHKSMDRSILRHAMKNPDAVRYFGKSDNHDNVYVKYV